MASVLDILRQQRQQLQRLVEQRGVRRLGKVYAESRAELRDRLAQLEREGRGQSFSAHHMRIMLLQSQHAVRYLEDRLGRELEGSGRLVASTAPRGMYRTVQALEQHFSGHSPVAQVEQAALFQRVYKGVEPSLMDRFRRSKRLYGPPVVAKIRLELAKGLVQGKTVDDMVSAVAGTGGIFDGQRWRAERIVRTELAWAHNHTQFQTMRALRDSGGPTHKKLLETFDDRTGNDSKILHGQIRRIDEPFVYDPPPGERGYPPFQVGPGRPNDRSVTVPWRPEWPESKLTEERPADSLPG